MPPHWVQRVTGYEVDMCAEAAAPVKWMGRRGGLEEGEARIEGGKRGGGGEEGEGRRGRKREGS